MPHSSPSEVAGYDCCTECGDYHPSILLWRTGKLCPACLGRRVPPGPTVEVVVEGRIAHIRRRPRRGGSRGSKSSKKLSEKARLAAMRRLAKLQPDLFDILLAEEREARGLEPWYVTAQSRPLDPEALQATLDSLVA